MRKQDIQLLAMARQGNAQARCEAARRYLVGAEGFPRHTKTGLEYLAHPSVSTSREAAGIIAESLPLQELVEHRQLDALQRSAMSGNAIAQTKLGAWVCTHNGQEGWQWLVSAARGGSADAERVVRMQRRGRELPLQDVLGALSSPSLMDGRAVAQIAASQALDGMDVARATRCMAAAVASSPSLSVELAASIVHCVRLAEESDTALGWLEPATVESGLEMMSTRGDRVAAYALGRALCGIACGALAPERIVSGINMRKGVAHLLRAADAGCDAAWMHLHRVHGDARSSIANAQLSRFFLEKAAMRGSADAQRKLGALLLRSSASLAESETAIHWLHKAAASGDPVAAQLLRSLVLPLPGTDDEALAAIGEVRRTDPWLAARLLLARRFGLTKLEALTVDPVRGRRPWGLVVGRNPFIAQARLSAPRAVPAASAQALADLERTAAFFEEAQHFRSGTEGDLRCRSLRQRRAFERYGVNEALFFAAAKSMTLETLRRGPKWAFRAREPLRAALAA